MSQVSRHDHPGALRRQPEAADGSSFLWLHCRAVATQMSLAASAVGYAAVASQEASAACEIAGLQLIPLRNNVSSSQNELAVSLVAVAAACNTTLCFHIATAPTCRH